MIRNQEKPCLTQPHNPTRGCTNRRGCKNRKTQRAQRNSLTRPSHAEPQSTLRKPFNVFHPIQTQTRPIRCPASRVGARHAVLKIHPMIICPTPHPAFRVGARYIVPGIHPIIIWPSRCSTSRLWAQLRSLHPFWDTSYPKPLILPNLWRSALPEPKRFEWLSLAYRADNHNYARYASPIPSV